MWDEAENLAAPFKNTLVKDFKLLRCGRDESVGVGESGDEGVLEDIEFTAGWG